MDIQSAAESTVLNMITKLSETSSRLHLKPKSIRSYRDWLLPYVRFALQEKRSEPGDRETADAYLDRLVLRHRDRTYIKNVRSLLQRLYRFRPELPNLAARSECRGRLDTDAKFLNADERMEVKHWATVHSHLRSPLLAELADFILIILYTGMRPFEVCELGLKNIDDLITSGRTRISGKTGERDVFGGKHEDAECFFKRLRDGALSRAQGNRIKGETLIPVKPFPRSTRAYRRAFHQLQTTLGFPTRRGLHCLRRAAGKTFQESNQERDLNAVKQFLGHRNTKTTELYLQDHGSDIMAKCDNMNTVSKRKLQEQ